MNVSFLSFSRIWEFDLKSSAEYDFRSLLKLVRHEFCHMIFFYKYSFVWLIHPSPQLFQMREVPTSMKMKDDYFEAQLSRGHAASVYTSHV